MRHRRPSTWINAVFLGLAAVSVLTLGGCGGPDPAGAGGVTLNLAAVKAGAAEGSAAVPKLALTLGDRFEVTGQDANANLSRVDLSYNDRNGKKAALVRVAVIYGEPDQTLDEKFTALTSEAKVSVAAKDSYQPVGAPVEFKTADGIAGQLRRYEFIEGANQKQAHVFAILDLRKQDAVYVRIQLLTPADNWERLEADTLEFLQALKRVAP